MNEIFERLLPRNIINCVCEYDGVIHEWAYIRMGLYLECFKCQYYGGLVHGGAYSRRYLRYFLNNKDL